MTDSLLVERVTQMLSAEPSVRNDDDLTMIMNWFKELSRAETKRGKESVLGELADSALRELVKFCELETHSHGTLLIKQGAEGDFMYIILIGECEIRIFSGESQLKEGDCINGGAKEFNEAFGVHVNTVGSGAVIGEVALVRNVPRTANVVVGSDDCSLIRISRELYNRTMESYLQNLEQEREEFASSFHLVSHFNPRLKQQFIRALMKDKYFNGDIIVRQGDKMEDVFFVVSGEILLYLNPKKLVQQYELHLQAKNIYSILPAEAKRRNGSMTARARCGRGGGGGKVGGSVLWSCVSNNAMLGDVEVLAQLPSRMTTAVAQTETVLFRMNLLEFKRLVLREGRDTARQARQLAKSALSYRNRLRRDKLQPAELPATEVPFVDYLVRAMDSMAQPT